MQIDGLLPDWRLAAGISLTLMIVGCSNIPRQSASSSSSTSPVSAKSAGVPLLPPANSGRGGYYKDDGPGEQIPPGLESTPDAEPKVEPYSPRANRPYEVFGKSYTPITDNRPFKQRGVGSWYGKKFHGKKTSSGEPYDMFKMTAAHPTLPIPSYTRVTNLNNGKQVIVRINDRGPFHSDRVIDLSYTAALKLGYLGKGSGMLEVEHLSPQDIERIVQTWRTSETGAVVAVVSGKTANSDSEPYPPLPESMFEENGKPAQEKISPTGYYIQLGAYTQAQNAEAMRTQHTLVWADKLPQAEVVQSGVHYRLVVGPFATREKATDAAQRVQQSGSFKPIVVQR